MNDQVLLASQPANALIRNAEASAAAMSRGLWVGGLLSLYGDRLEFAPNDANALLSKGTLAFTVPLASVTDVKRRFGVLTGIIDVVHAQGVTSVRCFGSRALASQIRDAARTAGARIAAR